MITSTVAFVGTRQVAAGALAAVVTALKGRATSDAPVFVFDAHTGRPIAIDLARPLPELLAQIEAGELPRTRGRPRLGVVSREVSLLPHQWAWLAQQRGGASAALRRLVDAARQAEDDDPTLGAAIDAAHRFLWAIAADLPDFEAATRALFARDFATFSALTTAWPAGIRAQLDRLLAPARAR